MADLKRALIMGGGTGGHVFPGLVIALALKERGVLVSWLGTKKGLEATLIPKENIPIYFISIHGVRGKGFFSLLRAPFQLLYATYEAICILRQLKPNVVIGMGGFVSGPGGLACRLLGYPLIIQEQNALPGTTNKYLSFIAAKIMEGFPNTFKNRKKVVTTGNPIRKEIANLKQASRTTFNLLILGGSLGSAAINKIVPLALKAMPLMSQPAIYHQTGEKNFAATKANYAEYNIKAKIEPFIEKMHEAYAWADVVLARSGALTVSELCAAGKGAILIPYPYATDDHQTINAKWMEKNNAAIVMSENELTAEKLAKLLLEWSNNQGIYQAMAIAAFTLRKVNATTEIIKICEEVCK